MKAPAGVMITGESLEDLEEVAQALHCTFPRIEMIVPPYLDKEDEVTVYSCIISLDCERKMQEQTLRPRLQVIEGGRSHDRKVFDLIPGRAGERN